MSPPVGNRSDADHRRNAPDRRIGAAMCCTDDEIEWAQIGPLCAELILARAVGNRRRKVSARQPHQCRLLLSPRPWCSPGFWPDAEGFRLQEGVLGSAGEAG